MQAAVKRALPKDELKAERQALQREQMQKLFDEVIATGCDFHIEADELRLVNMSAMSGDLWARFDHFGGCPEFMELARKHAESKTAET